MNFKKRRHQKTINKNDAKVRRGQAVMDRPAMGVMYGSVSKMSVQMDFYSPEGHLLAQETRQFEPSDSVDFQAPCPGRCGNGRTDMEAKLRSMVERHETGSEARAKCPEILLAGGQDMCGTELRCQIRITYKD